MPTPYQRGVRMEHQAVEDLRELGYEAQRTAGSHGPFDIVAWDGNDVMFIQVKRVQGVEDLGAAMLDAVDAWEDHQKPDTACVLSYVWVRCQGKWHTFRLD